MAHWSGKKNQKTQQMEVTTQTFGLLADGREAKLFHFESAGGITVKITNYGGIVTSIQMLDKQGKREEITAGFPHLKGYINDHPYFGALVGRYANRIAKGRFRIDNTEYHLPVNNGPNHLHGGLEGFDKKLWDYELKESTSEASLQLNYFSVDMEEGYPGNLSAKVTYTLNDSNEIAILYEAGTDADTHVNLTNHTYFNLGGFRSPIYDHHLQIYSELYLEMDRDNIPTGRLLPTQNTLLDFCYEEILEPPVKETPGGLDYCFVLSRARDFARPVAWLSHKPTGRKISVYTTQPAIQIYSGNFLTGEHSGHNGTKYEKHSAICLETQHYPDSPNHPEFPSTLLKAGEKYQQETKFVFQTMKE